MCSRQATVICIAGSQLSTAGNIAQARKAGEIVPPKLSRLTNSEACRGSSPEPFASTSR